MVIMMKMHCWNCNTGMKKVKDSFHNFEIDAWKCPKCREIIYDEEEIQPILHYNKLKESKKMLTATVGMLGKSKIFRLPRVVEQIYGIYKGEKLKFDLRPDEIVIKMKE